MTYSLDEIEVGVEEARDWLESTGDRSAGRTTADTWLVRLVESVVDDEDPRNEQIRRIISAYNSF